MRHVEEPLLTLVKDLDRLLELEVPEEVKEKIWTLLMDVNEYRRKQEAKEAAETK